MVVWAPPPSHNAPAAGDEDIVRMMAERGRVALKRRAQPLRCAYVPVSAASAKLLAEVIPRESSRSTYFAMTSTSR